MRNRITKFSILLSFVAFAMTGCNKENNLSAGEGAVALSLKAGNENLIIRSTKADQSLSDLTYSLTVTNSDGVVVKRVPDLKESDHKVSLLAKSYDFKIESGKLTDKGFDVPYYIAEKSINVVANKVTPIDMKLKLGNIKVTVEYDEKLTQYLSNCETLITCGANDLTFTMDEKRAGYLKPEEGATTLNWSLSLFPINGAEQIEGGSVANVKANDHIKLKFSVEEGDYVTGGLRIVAIKVIEDVIPQDCDLNIGISRYPEANLVGRNIMETQNVISSAPEPLTITLAAFPEIEAIQMSYNIKILDEDSDNGSSYDLMLLLQKPEGGTIKDFEDKNVFINYTTITECNNAVQVVLSADFLNQLAISTDDSEPYKFTFTITAKDKKRITKTLVFNKINSDVVTLEPNKLDVWATKIDFKGRWRDQPTNLSFNYSDDGGKTWQSIAASSVDAVNKTFSVTVKGLKPSKEYRYRAVGNSSSNMIKVTTEATTQLYNSNFDMWKQEGSTWYLRESSAFPFWDSGNKGATTIGSNNPTEPETADVVNGKAARLTSKVIFNNFAAGNLFAGEFFGVNITTTTPDMTFGRPFTSRPFALEGKYKYNSKTVNNGNTGGVSGKPDRFIMYIIITNGDNMPRRLNEKNKSPFDLDKIMQTGTDGNVKAIASGMFTNEEFDKMTGNDITKVCAMNSYENFKIPLTYHAANKGLEPKYIVVVFSASKYGDFFTGGEGSSLLLDEMTLNYDF